MNSLVKLTLPALTLLSTIPFTAQAQDQASQKPNFDYAELSYTKVDFDGEKVDGFMFELEKSFGDNWFSSFDYITASDEYSDRINGIMVDAEADLSLSFANVGYRFPTTETTSMYVEAGFANIALDATVAAYGSVETIDESDSGWNVAVGVRSALTPAFQVDLKARHIDISDTTDREISIEGRYFINDKFSVSANYASFKDDLSYFGVGAAYHF